MSACDPWKVVAYEVRMFRATYEIVLNATRLEKLPKVFANSVEESAVLHTRILCDLFLSRHSGDDDIILRNLLPNLYSDYMCNRLRRLIRGLGIKYGSASSPNSYCWVFNKMMAHPTAHRGASYDYTAILRDLQPLIEDIIAEIESLRAAPFTWTW